MKYLLLWLEAPLQSWGHDSKFSRRETLPFPTKSGIYGLMLAALGARGTQEELLGKLGECSMTVMSYNLTHRNEALPQLPFLVDFQMVGSGYRDDQKEHPWERMLIPKKSDGGKAVGGGSKITYRYYLEDARFAIVSELPEELATKIGEALKSPVFDIHLGRKNCQPTDYVFRGLFSFKDEAEAEARAISDSKNLKLGFRVEEGEGSGDVLILNDVPVRFGDRKEYRERKVSISRPPIQ